MKMKKTEACANRSSSIEWRRKAFHLSSLYIPFLYAFLSKETALFIIIPVTLIFISFDGLRIFNKKLNESFIHLFRRLMREGEEKRLTGSSYFLVGCSLSILLFQKPVAILAILVLIISDTLAYIVGKRFGRTTLFEKTVEGSLSFFLSAIIIGAIFPGIPFLAFLFGAMAATLVEALPLPIDDNISVPLVAGGTITALY